MKKIIANIEDKDTVIIQMELKEADQGNNKNIIKILNEKLIPEPIQVTTNKKTYNQYKIQIDNTDNYVVINTPQNLKLPVGKQLSSLKIFNQTEIISFKPILVDLPKKAAKFYCTVNNKQEFKNFYIYTPKNLKKWLLIQNNEPNTREDNPTIMSLKITPNKNKTSLTFTKIKVKRQENQVISDEDYEIEVEDQENHINIPANNLVINNLNNNNESLKICLAILLCYIGIPLTLGLGIGFGTESTERGLTAGFSSFGGLLLCCCCAMCNQLSRERL